MYRHVATKGELMELAVDDVLKEVTVPQTDEEDWRRAVAGCAHSFRATALRHPWLCAELGQAGLAYLGPNLTALSEGLITTLTDAGFAEPHTAVDVVFSYTIGMSTTECAWLITVARSRQSEARFLARLVPATDDETGQHPDDRTETSAPRHIAIRDAKFGDGLAMVLDGLATRLPN